MRSGLLRRAYVTILTKKGNAPFAFFPPCASFFFPLVFFLLPNAARQNGVYRH